MQITINIIKLIAALYEYLLRLKASVDDCGSDINRLSSKPLTGYFEIVK